MRIIREFIKLLLIMLFWAFPIYLWQVSQRSGYLWLFIVSFVLTCFTFTHYESLAESEGKEPEVKIDVPKEKHRVTVEDLFPHKEE